MVGQDGCCLRRDKRIFGLLWQDVGWVLWKNGGDVNFDDEISFWGFIGCNRVQNYRNRFFEVVRS